MIRCPRCKERSEVLETSQRGEMRAHRRRRCLNPHCLHRFATIEVTDKFVQPLPTNTDPVEDDAIRAAGAVDARRAQIARAQKAERKRDRNAWYDTGFESAPELRDEADVLKLIRGY